MVFTTAMETRNDFHYCYGDEEWFSLLLWTQGMAFITAMETRNRFHYCYGDNEWFSLLLWRKNNRFHYYYGDEEWFTLLLWRRRMVYTTAMDTRNGFHYCYGEKEWFCDIIWYILCFSDYFRHLWNYNEINNHIYCVFRIILDTYGIIMKIQIIY